MPSYDPRIVELMLENVKAHAEANERFNNVTVALLALVKPEWKREAQLIIDQLKQVPKSDHPIHD